MEAQNFNQPGNRGVRHNVVEEFLEISSCVGVNLGICAEGIVIDAILTSVGPRSLDETCGKQVLHLAVGNYMFADFCR